MHHVRCVEKSNGLRDITSSISAENVGGILTGMKRRNDNAIQKPSAAQVDAREQARDGRTVGEGNAAGQEAAQACEEREAMKKPVRLCSDCNEYPKHDDTKYCRRCLAKHREAFRMEEIDECRAERTTHANRMTLR